ncbi:MAG: flagellar protein FlaG [Betaproteobacteria bacterium]|nr:flagellar protein FlaG [Betaproteobacteria bacterium]
METIGINGTIAGVGFPSRASQASPQSPTSRTMGTVDVPAASDTDEARAGRRSQEAGSDTANLRQAVQESVEKLNEFIRPYVTSLQFSIDEDLGKVVVRIMDDETKEVIKQIPSEDVLALAKALSKVSGLFVKQEA